MSDAHQPRMREQLLAFVGEMLLAHPDGQLWLHAHKTCGKLAALGARSSGYAWTHFHRNGNTGAEPGECLSCGRTTDASCGSTYSTPSDILAAIDDAFPE